MANNEQDNLKVFLELDPMQARIFVVDDDEELLELLRLELEAAHYQVMLARNGQTALHEFRALQPDLLVLDVNLPGLDGLSVCREIRKHSSLPILMLSSQREDYDKVVGLEVGADDYLGKPYHPRELIARIRALLRRSRAEWQGSPEVLRAGSLELDLGCHQARENGVALALTPIELVLLEALMRASGAVVPRSKLLESIWGSDFAGSTRTLDTHMRNLRLKLSAESARVESVRGVGFRLVVSEIFA